MFLFQQLKETEDELDRVRSREQALQQQLQNVSNCNIKKRMKSIIFIFSDSTSPGWTEYQRFSQFYCPQCGHGRGFQSSLMMKAAFCILCTYTNEINKCVLLKRILSVWFCLFIHH